MNSRYSSFDNKLNSSGFKGDKSLHDNQPASLDEEASLPTVSLKDSMKQLANPKTRILRMDAIIPSTTNSHAILQLFLNKMTQKTSNPIQVLSLKFNRFDNRMRDIFICWLETNNTLETLYVSGSGFDGASMKKLHQAWKKRLFNHRFENNGNSLYRYSSSDAEITSEIC